MSSTGQGIADLKDQVQRDIIASEDLQVRIDELRVMITDGKTLTDANSLGDVETEGRRMLKDLLRRIDQIEEQPNLDATDREMLQALNARQVICDKQVMQLAELRDLHRQARGLDFEGLDDFLKPAVTLGPVKTARMYRQKDEGKSSLPLSTAHVEAPPGPSVEESAEPADTKGVGVAEYVTSPPTHPIQGVHGEDVYEVVYDDEEDENDRDDNQEDEDNDPEPDKESWPLCYRILDVDPSTEPRQFEEVCNK